MAKSNWAESFIKGSCPDPKDLSGIYKVIVVQGIFPNLDFLQQKKHFTPIKPDFDGCNLLFRSEKAFGYFRFAKGSGIAFPDTEVLKIEYKDPRNPFWLRPLIDDCVQIGEKKFLGMAMYPLFSKPVNLAYFRMEGPDL